MPAIDATLKQLLSGQALSFAEAKDAMGEIMRGEVSPVRLAAWLVALRMKGETAAEIGGCAAAMTAAATPIPCENPRAIDLVGTGGDGAGSHNLSTAAAFVAAGAGLTVAKHGNRAVSSRSGSADVLAALGVCIELAPQDMAACLHQVGMAFLFAPLLHPAMKHAMPVRKELGTRTIFNILGPLTNPAGVKRLVIGVYDPALCPLVAEACRELGRERVLVVHGAGLDELSQAAVCRVWELNRGEITEFAFDARKFGVPRCRKEDLAGSTPAANAAAIREVLTGRSRGPLRDAICLNAAAGLLVADEARDWREGVAMAAAAIDDGRAAAKLAELVAFTSAKGPER